MEQQVYQSIYRSNSNRIFIKYVTNTEIDDFINYKHLKASKILLLKLQLLKLHIGIDTFVTSIDQAFGVNIKELPIFIDTYNCSRMSLNISRNLFINIHTYKSVFLMQNTLKCQLSRLYQQSCTSLDKIPYTI